MTDKLLDSRRLTGPHVLSAECAAVIDVALPEATASLRIRRWQDTLQRIVGALRWPRSVTHVRRVDGGASLAFEAPPDVLYAATEINECAWLRSAESGYPDEVLEADVQRLAGLIAEEEHPRLRALLGAARRQGIPALLDDEQVTFGLGCRGRTWPRRALPEAVPWPTLGRIPVGLVTGTNGKTTTVRLVARMAREAGLTPGWSTTDGVYVDDGICEPGDYAGPEGARKVLRDTRVELAVLETARGGMLRRGLPVRHADAVCITNVAADHLGDFGVADLDELAAVKWSITRALTSHGRAVLNGDDARLRRCAADAAFPVTWFGLDGDAPPLARHIDAGGHAATVSGGHLIWCADGNSREIAATAAVPITLGAAARHNIANCLAAIALADALGIGMEAIRNALLRMAPNDNDGRLNIYRIKGATVLVDFAHNPHAMAALAAMAAALAPSRRLVLMGQAGDRSDTAIRELAQTAWQLRPDKVLLKEMPHYLRGRESGAVVELLRRGLEQVGAPPEAIEVTASEADGIEAALAWLRPGDLAILLVHEDRAGAITRLRGLAEAAQT
jgi:UDP-N-acetylmuramyl tripeptide synthase